MTGDPLDIASDAALAIQTEHETDPTASFAPLPGQLEMLSSSETTLIFRAGQQSLGKTTAGAIDTIGHVTGLHRWRPEAITRWPLLWWILVASFEGSVDTTQRKVWELLPKHLLHPDSRRWDPSIGFGVRHPGFLIRHVPSGGWSKVAFKSTHQDELDLAGATLGGAWFDEVPRRSRLYQEVRKRTMRAGEHARVVITATPINAGRAGAEWIAEEVREGRMVDIHRRLEPEELIPVGRTQPICTRDGTVCDAAWIAEKIAETLPHEVPVVIHGEWSMSAEAPVFTAFRLSGPRRHVREDVPDGDVEVVVGVDHGVQAHTQAAVVVAVDRSGEHPRLWVLGEYQSDGETTEDDDADGILAMLDEVGVRWCDLWTAYGDRPHPGQRRFSLAGKSNSGLQRALERAAAGRRHGISPGAIRPPIRPAKRGAANAPGSVAYGCTWLHRLMVRDGHLSIHPRCGHLISSIQGYDLRQNTDEAHLVDALRYALRDLIYRRTWSAPVDAAEARG